MAPTWRDWLSNAARSLPQPQARRSSSSPQQEAEDSGDEGQFIYNRVLQHSDDEDEPGPLHRPATAPPEDLPPTAHHAASAASRGDTASARPAASHGTHVSSHHASHSDGDLLGAAFAHTDARAASGQQLPSPTISTYPSDGLLALDACVDQPTSSSTAPAMGRLSLQDSRLEVASEGVGDLQPSSSGRELEGGSSADRQQRGASTSGVNDDDDDDDDDDESGHDYSNERRELLIYAIPLTAGKFTFLPVTPWREEPEAHSGIRGAIEKQVDKATGEASDMWQKLGDADRQTIANRIYRFGRRVLESVPAEERLMRGIPKQISKVIIYHPASFPPDEIQQQMQTMTKSYGIKAVGRAAAATVMLPLALGVDLIILPGPQVLTYYTLWELWRSTNGAVGTQRMAKFVTQGGTYADIRVNYVCQPKLDHYVEVAAECPEGVLSEEDIESLVTELREPNLLEPLLELRNQNLRRLGVARGGYSRLPGAELAGPLGNGGSSGGGAAPVKERWSWGGSSSQT